MNKDVAHFFRDQLRHARAAALRDAENFEEIVFVFERVGMLLLGKMGGLGKYTHVLNQQAPHSSLAVELPTQWNEFHAPFSRLYESVPKARNAALHEGAFARHLTTNAIALALIMEDALMDSSEYVRDYMVKNPICASLWQSLVSFDKLC